MSSLSDQFFDVVIIGSGPGGAVTACTLAEAGKNVLILEEGMDLGIDSCPQFSLEEMTTKYRNGGVTAALGRSNVAYVEGKVVGGGSEINSGLYHRTPPQLLKMWRDRFDLQQADERDLDLHFMQCEQDVNVSLLPETPPEASLRMQAGADALGWKVLEIPRWIKFQQGAAPRRQSMSETYLPRALTAGAELRTNIFVDRIERRKNRWRIICGGPRGAQTEIVAKDVFVAAGSINTPAILRRSGIKKNIGNSLQLHPTVKIVAEFDRDINHPGMGVSVHQVKEFSPEMSFGCSVSSMSYLSLGLLGYPEIRRGLADRWRRMATYYAMITPQGQGSVRCHPFSSDPLVRFDVTNGDAVMLTLALKRLARLLFKAGAVALYPTISGMKPIRSEAELVQIPARISPKKLSLMTIHLFSSCPMGENRSICATDSWGAVHDVPNLYIADGSLLPSATSVNPQGSIMGFVRRNAFRYLENN